MEAVLAAGRSALQSVQGVTKAGSKTASSQVNEGGWCHSCMNRAYAGLMQITGAWTPEQKRRNEFEQRFARTLKDGQVCKLVDYEHEESVDVLSAMSRTALSFLGSSASQSSQKEAKQGVGSPVLVKLCTEGGVAIEWSSLALEQNRPKHFGTVKLGKVQLIDKIDRGRESHLVLRDSKGKVLLAVSCEDSQSRDTWVAGLNEAVVVLAGDIESGEEESIGLLDQQRRYLDLEERKRQREAQKKALGNVGMKFTAQAMINKT